MKQNQRVALSKRLLKDGLIELMKKKELNRITVTELCEISGINRATFYRHYQIPQDVLEEIEIDFFSQMKELYKTPSTMEEYEASIRGLCVFVGENAELFRMIVRSAESMQLVEVMNRRLYQLIEKEYDLDGHLHEFDEESKHLLLSYIGGGGYFMLRKWLMEDVHKTPDEVADMLIRAVKSMMKII